MAPGAEKQPSLLYVSNESVGDVTVYTYLNGKDLQLAGTLYGFRDPAGMCTDKAGNIWIPDYVAQKIYKYKHGGTKPIKIIQERGNSDPRDCSVDLNTGNLAVVNQDLNGPHFRPGNIKVYLKGSHTAIKYPAPGSFTQLWFLGYDNNSNLYVDGYRGTLFELPKGGSGLVELTVQGGSLRAPNAIQWVKPFMLIGDQTAQGTSVAYKVFVSGNVATIAGNIAFKNTDDTDAFWRRGGKVIVPDNYGSTVRVYTLSDGSLVSSTTNGVDHPFGAVVSQAGQGS